MKRTLAGLAVVVALVSPSAQASQSGSGTTSIVQVTKTGVALFNHNGNRDARPACATNAGRWAFNVTTAAGQAQLSLLLTAYSIKQPVVVTGTGQCDLVSSVETVEYIYTAE